MAEYPNPRPTVPVPDTTGPVAKDNLITLDYLMNSDDPTYTNRFGRVSPTAVGIQQEISDQFNATFQAQFAYKRIGNISDYAGNSLPETDKLNSYQFPDDSGNWYGPLQNQSFPIVIPTDPSVDDGWSLTTAATTDYVNSIASGYNLIYNSSFDEPGSVTNHPDSTPRSYTAGDEIFLGVFALVNLSAVTYVGGEIDGSGQLYVDVYKTEKQKLSTSQFVASIASSDGVPSETGAAILDEGDYWRVVFDMNSTFSVKLEQGDVATSHKFAQSKKYKDDIFVVYDYHNGIIDGNQDYQSAFDRCVNALKQNGGGKLSIPDLGFIVRKSDVTKIDINQAFLDGQAAVGPFGSFTGHLFELTTNANGDPFFGGSPWLWPKRFAGTLRIDGRSPDLSVNQCKSVFLNRVSHSKVEIFDEFCIGHAFQCTGVIETDIFLSQRMSGAHTASYVSHSGKEWCCQRTHSTAKEPGVDTDFWAECPVGSDPNGTAPAWVSGNSYKNGADGAPMYFYDPAGAPDANNNIRVYGYNSAYPKGSMLHIDCDQSQFGARNIFFYGPQLHHQDGDITGSEGSAQPNYEGPIPAAESKQSYGVGVELKNCELIHFIGFNARKGLEAGGTLWHFGDSEQLKACRGITFSQGAHSGSGGTATGTELTLFDFDSVSETLSAQGVVFGDGVSIREISSGSKLYRGDISKLTKNRFGRETKTMLGSTTDTSYDQYMDGESLARFSIRADGRHSWGDGSNPQDCGLTRNGVGLLYADTGKIGANEGFIIGSGYTAGGTHGAEQGTVNLYGPGGGLLAKLIAYAPS